MRIFQHSVLPLALIFFCPYLAEGQTTVSDTKMMRLKGAVRSVVSTSKAVSGYSEHVLKDQTKYETTYHFDRAGNLTEEVWLGGSNSRVVFTRIDGYKTFKSFELESANKERPNAGGFGSTEIEKPIEPNEKLTAPDKRYDFKYAYETDARGRVTVERQFGSNGKLFRKRTFDYDEQSADPKKERAEDTIAIMVLAFKYDGTGNVVEIDQTRDIKGTGSDSRERIVYSDFKFDLAGNWTERKSTRQVKTDGLPEYKIAPRTYTLVNVEYRTIIYY